MAGYCMQFSHLSGLLAPWAWLCLCPKYESQKIWGVPLVPWVPSLSVALNIFLLGTLDRLSFIRFEVWTGAILVYRFFFGLHALYNTAIQQEEIEQYKLQEGEEGQNLKTDNPAAQEMNKIPASEPIEHVG